MKLIKEQTVNEYKVVINKLNSPELGGYYQTSLFLGKNELNKKSGLCLAAACEIFQNTVNAILTHKFNKQFS